MKRFKIHYTLKGTNVVDDVDDYFIIEGETIYDIRNEFYRELNRRNLDDNENNCWSEEIK